MMLFILPESSISNITLGGTAAALKSGESDGVNAYAGAARYKPSSMPVNSVRQRSILRIDTLHHTARRTGNADCRNPIQGR